MSIFSREISDCWRPQHVCRNCVLVRAAGISVRSLPVQICKHLAMSLTFFKGSELGLSSNIMEREQAWWGIVARFYGALCVRALCTPFRLSMASASRSAFVTQNNNKLSTHGEIRYLRIWEWYSIGVSSVIFALELVSDFFWKMSRHLEVCEGIPWSQAGRVYTC